jgi:acyl-[acyl-carrier-protein] desaturase
MISHSFSSKLEVLTDLEPVVADLIQKHEAKRALWYPSDFLPADQGYVEEQPLLELGDRTRNISDSARVAVALNILTEEGLPHFHRLLAEQPGNRTFWSTWNNLWTAEEDRHGNVLRDYVRDSRLLNFSVLERLQFQYIQSGFNPDWRGDPYKIFAYTSCQEKATQISHLNTGKLVAQEEPLLYSITQRISQDEARHFAFYMNIFKEILHRDPNHALLSACSILPSIDMPRISIINFNEYADVVRRAGIYGPREYKEMVEHLISNWKVGVLQHLDELGRKAQDKIMALPARLEKVAEYIESRCTAKSFRFDVVFGRVLQMG